MKVTIIITSILFLNLCIHLPVKAQVHLNIGWEGICDNREYFSTVQYPQTILGMRGKSSLSYSFDTTSTLTFGGSFLYEYGDLSQKLNPNITMYYHLQKPNYTLKIGAFPRTGTINYPLAIITDTLLYYRPNIEGGYFRLGNSFARQDVWVDWTSRQTMTNRENFLFGTSGQINLASIFVQNYFAMLHNAGPMVKPPGDYLQDNGAAMARVGLDLSEIIPFDSISLSLGMIQFLDRKRGIYDWKLNRGATADFSIEHKWMGIYLHYFKGKGQEVIFGDSFYKADEYGRIAVFCKPFQLKGVHSRIELDFDFVERKIDSSQKFFIYADIDKFFR